MYKYTPGPWRREMGAGRGAWIEGADGNFAALACGETDERADANACLIEMAPELLEALEYALWRDSNDDTWTGAELNAPETPEWVRRAYRAVAKAKGES